MRSLFEDSLSPDYVFKGRDRSVPFSGFGKYASDVWGHIQANAELDIPSLQTMLATYKCQNTSSQILKVIRDNLKQNPCRLEAQLLQGGSEAWSSWQPVCSEWVDFVCEQAKVGNLNFRQATVGYKETAVAEELQKLNDAISSEVASSVGSLLDSLHPQASCFRVICKSLLLVTPVMMFSPVLLAQEGSTSEFKLSFWIL
jgi:hypothetical protein